MVKGTELGQFVAQVPLPDGTLVQVAGYIQTFTMRTIFERPPHGYGRIRPPERRSFEMSGSVEVYRIISEYDLVERDEALPPRALPSGKEASDEI